VTPRGCAPGAGPGRQQARRLGESPWMLAKFTLGGGANDFYDVRNVDGFNLPVDIEPAAGAGGRSSRRRAQWTSTGCARVRWRRGMAAARWWAARACAWRSARMSTAAAGGSRRRQHAGRAGTGGCSRRSAHRPTATPMTGAAPSPATTA